MSITKRSGIVAGAVVAFAAGVVWACPPDSASPPPTPHTPAGDTAKAPSARDRAIAKYLKERKNSPGKDYTLRNASYRASDEPVKQEQTYTTAEPPEWMTNLVPAAGSPESKALAKANKTRIEHERDLKKLRAKYFHGVRNTEIRQVGILKLREYSDAALFPLMINIFQEEEQDTQNALLDHLRDLRTDEADASIAWCAVFGKQKTFREAAAKRVTERTAEVGSVSNRVKWVVSLGLRDRANDSVVASARLAQGLKLYEAIPMLINAQITQSAGPSRADDGGDPALAYILIGTQEAFISQLTPIVGDNAVGFNPQLSVVTSGVVLRIIDAVVITYRVEVNSALIGLSSDGWGGQSTAPLGWDQRAWRMWYANEFVPYRRKVDAELAAAKPASDAPATVKK